MIIIVGSLVLVSAIAITLGYGKTRTKKRLQEMDRQKRVLFFELNFEYILEAHNDFLNLCDFEGPYFSNHRLTQWKERHNHILSKKVSSQRFGDLGFLPEKLKVLNGFVEMANDPEGHRSTFNNEFFTRELRRAEAVFSDVDGHSLDFQQREAIIRDEDNSLVIAGAGCGKTTTIMGKVKYLNEKLNVDSDQILLISFTRKSAEDLRKKVNLPGVNISTFHKLGLDIIREVDNAPPSIYDQDCQSFLSREFQRLIEENTAYLNKTVKYFSEYLRIEKDEFEFVDFSESIQHLMDQNFRPFGKKLVTLNGRETYKREIVKSQQECKIANFLLFHGIRYEYEEPYEFDTKTSEFRQYAPDFSIYHGDIRIYLEHYGIDENGNIPSFFVNEDQTYAQAKTIYNNGIEWKRNLHQTNNTICLETFSYQFKDDDTVFESLKNQLGQAGILCEELSTEEKWRLIKEADSDAIDKLLSLFNTFLSQFKSNNYSFDNLVKKAKELEGFNRRRTQAFLDLFHPLYTAYERMLNGRDQIDFSDMINRATEYVNSGQYGPRYKYIIIDEFQDISFGRYKLLKAFKDQDNALKFFAVGDDWQSIYRFTGSDVTLFNKFEDYFGVTQRSKIETTYRFGNPLLDISSNFIMDNPNQIKKELKSKTAGDTHLQVIYSDGFENDDTKALEDALTSFVHGYLENKSDLGLGKKDIGAWIKQEKFLVLGRYNFDIGRINTEEGRFWLKGRNTLMFKYDQDIELELPFITVHGSKGLEADYVFILNCNSGTLGFPSEIVDDPVLSILMEDSEGFPNSEERRLFYVALSRAKKRVFCISNKYFTSKFIREIDVVGTEDSSNMKCPRCKVGTLVLKKGASKIGKEWAFYGCSNFASYGCGHKIWVDNSNNQS